MTPLDRAIEIAGSVTALSRRLGFPFPSTVTNWKRNGGLVPEDHCPAVERETGVRCEELRPDKVWVRDSGGQPIAYQTAVPAACGPAEAANDTQSEPASPPNPPKRDGGRHA